MMEADSFARLAQALRVLDGRLSEQGIEGLELRIAGGFAHIAQGVRDAGFTPTGCVIGNPAF